MTKNPRNYPKTMPSPESGRPMTRGEKMVSFKVGGRKFSYKQPGWWCSLTDPDDMEGQLVEPFLGAARPYIGALSQDVPGTLFLLLPSPLAKRALIMDVAGCDFARACQLLSGSWVGEGSAGGFGS